MAIDLNAIRNRLNTLQTKVTKTDNLWKPTPGKQQIRILPYTHNTSNPFIELYFHFGFGGKNIISPSSFGEADPLLEFAEKLKSTGNRDDYQLSRKLTPKMRTYVPVLVRGEESEGVKFWGFGKNVYQELLGFFADPDYGDLTDPVNGRDVTVEFKTAAELGKSYPETYIRVKPNTSSVSEDANIVNSSKEQIELPSMFKKVTYEEMEGMLKEWLETGEVSDAKEQPAAETATPTTSTAPASNVKEAFDDLFND
jgi:hypothetical protein|tara:strand:+ start:339 stop:1100 length:762 start_codon:yes stop_codon:yes gene_type:complete